MKYVFLIVVLIPFVEGYCQQEHKFSLHNSKDSAIVPYATVKILHSKEGTFANELGEFSVLVKPEDYLSISSIGFEEKTTVVSAIIDNRIFLIPQIVALKEVTVTNKKPLGPAVLGITKAATDFNWGASGQGEEFAQLIELPAGVAFIKINKVMLSAQHFNDDRPILLHIYEVDLKSSAPGRELLQNKHLIISNNFRRKQIIVDIAAENLIIDTAFFVGFEWLGRAGAASGKLPAMGTVLNMTFSINRALTYSRVLGTKEYHWFPCVFSKTDQAHVRPANTMFSIEADQFK